MKLLNEYCEYYIKKAGSGNFRLRRVDLPVNIKADEVLVVKYRIDFP